MARIRLSEEPGTAEVIPVPMMIEHAEPGGVSCTTRKSSPAALVGVQPPTQHLIETLSPVDVGNGHDHNLDFQIHGPALLIRVSIRRLGAPQAYPTR
jgi:hypothetical protein